MANHDNLTCHGDAEDTSKEGDGVDPDRLLLGEGEVAVVVGAVVGVEVVEDRTGPHEHRPHPEPAHRG